jgi:hypothetical protein
MPRCHDNYHSFEAAWMLKNLIMKKIWSPINPTISSFPLAIYILLPLFSIGIIGSELLFSSLIYYVVMLTTESLLGVVLWFQESVLRSLLPRELRLFTFVERMASDITISYMHT